MSIASLSMEHGRTILTCRQSRILRSNQLKHCPQFQSFQGCYNNLLKIVDAKDVVANKAPNVEKVEEATKLGVANFVEKCFSDAALHETVQREKLFSAGSFSNFSSNFSENEDQRSEVSDDFDDFPDLDEALDLENPIFITESPLPNRSMKISEKAVTDTHAAPRRQDTWQNALDCIVQHSQSMSSVFSQSNQQQLSPTPPVSIDASATTMRNPTPTTNSPLGHLTQTPSLDITKPDEPQDESIPESVSSSSNNKTPSVGIPKISAPSPSQVFSPALPSAHPLSSTNPQLTATSVEDSPANSSSLVLHSADDRSTEEEEFKDRPTEPRVVEVDLSTGKSDLISTENDPLFKIDSVKKLSSLTAKRESGSPVNPEEDRSASVGNVDKLCLVNATRSEQSQLTGGVAKTGDDLQVQPNCEVPVTKGNVMDSASTIENRDLEVTVGHICERDSVPDKQAADPENESSLEGRNPGVAELSMQNSSDGQSCPPRITDDRKSNETSVKHELSPAAQVNLRDEKPKSTVEDEISTEYVNDSNDDECIQEIREIAGQSEASQKGQGSKLIDEMLLFNLNEMGKRRDLGSDQMNATPQNLEEKDRAGVKSEPLVKQYEENKDGLEEMVQVLPESSPAVGHGIDDVKTFSPTPMSEEKMIDAKSTALEVIQIAASEEKDFEATLQKAAPEVREEVLEKNVVDQFLPIVQASVTESVGLEVIQDEPNVKNKAEIDIIQNLPNSEEVCTKSADTTDVEVTVPALEKEETSTDLPEMTEYATNEKEITSRRIEEDPRENGNVSESHKHLVDVESVSRDFDCSNLEFEASPGLAAANEISRKDATDSQMSPADKKEDPPVQQVLLPDGIKSSDIQITSESDEQTDDPPETLSTQQGSVKDNAVENPKSDHLTQSLTIESEKGIKDEEASTADNESKNISERVPLVRTEEETNLKSTTSEKSVDTNLDTKPDVKAEEFQNVSKRKERKASKFNFVKKLKKLVPLSVDSKVHSACLL